MKKVALITGINGQDGSYLAEFLLKKGYEVHGTIRRHSLANNNKLVNIINCIDKIKLHTLSLEDHLSIYKLVLEIQPDECYHLAAASFVSYEFSDEVNTISTNFNSTHYLLSTIKETAPKCRFYYSGSSEMFGEAETSPQDENTKFNPRSIYGISKLSSYYIVKNYRERQGVFACTGILYNHESIRRDYAFVTRKITSTVAAIKKGIKDNLEVGNIDAIRDWGYAPEYVEAMWLMLNCDNPDDYVVATGVGHSVRDFIDIAFSYVGLNYKDYLVINKDYFRPSEENPLIGNAKKMETTLNFKPKIKLENIIIEMLEYDINLLKKQIF